jgi:hypothetical protein
MNNKLEQVLTKNILNYAVFQVCMQNILHEGHLFEEEINNFLEKVESYLCFYFYKSNLVNIYQSFEKKIVCERYFSEFNNPCIFTLHFFQKKSHVNSTLPRIVLYHNNANFSFYNIEMKIWSKWPLIMLLYCYQKKNIFYSNF